MIEKIGNFIDNLPLGQEYLVIGFSPSAISLKQRWHNNGLSADFLANYLATFFPPSLEACNSPDKHTEIKGTVAYIANELLENAMKYNNNLSLHPISIELHLSHESIIFVVTNSIHPQKVKEFQTYLQKILASDPQELYLQQLEKNAMEEMESSGLGFLTILNDYNAKLGWEFKTIDRDPEQILVTTMAEVSV